MITKILMLALTFILSSAWAQDAAEEALILNQELQFLEDAANDMTIAGGGSTSSVNIEATAKALPTGEVQSLEDAFFGSDEDTVETRTAAPNRARVQRRRN